MWDEFFDRCRSMIRDVFAMCMVLGVLGLVLAGLNFFGAAMTYAGALSLVGALMFLIAGLVARKIKVPDSASVAGLGVPGFLVLAGLVGLQMGSGALVFSSLGQILLLFVLVLSAFCLAKLWFVWSVCDQAGAVEPKLSWHRPRKKPKSRRCKTRRGKSKKPDAPKEPAEQDPPKRAS